MNVTDLFGQLKTSLDELEAALRLLDFTPQVTEIDTRIKSLTGLVRAMVTPPEA